MGEIVYKLWGLTQSWSQSRSLLWSDHSSTPDRMILALHWTWCNCAASRPENNPPESKQ